MTNAGANVRLIRQQVGMSLRALADAADLDPSTLSRVENGKTQLTPEIASKLAAVLHVSTGIFFTEAGVVETAMLRMRKAPLLTKEQLLAWTGPDSFEEAPDQVYLHTPLETATRHVFALRVDNQANEPEIRPGDTLVFDARRNPQFGDFVVAQHASGLIYMGQYRSRTLVTIEGFFDIVPHNRLFPVIPSSAKDLVLRGVLFEQRRTF